MAKYTRSRIMLAGALVGLMTAGCGDESPTTAGKSADPAQLGTVRLALQSTGSSGNTYRLEKATFSFKGPQNASVSKEGAAEFVTIDVLAGPYKVTLEKGWQLSRIQKGIVTPVPAARLVSPNPMDVNVALLGITDVVFNFDITGEPIEFGHGRAKVRFTVHEGLCGNGHLDPGEECDVGKLQLVGVACDTLCTGQKLCSNDSQCQSGKCDDAACVACDRSQSDCDAMCGTKRADCFDGCFPTCQTNCKDLGRECKNSCQATRNLCLVACGFPFNPACAVCFAIADTCTNNCEAGSNGCAAACGPECSSTCGAANVGCAQGCVTDKATCQQGCKRCSPCSAVQSCPLQRTP